MLKQSKRINHLNHIIFRLWFWGIFFCSFGDAKKYFLSKGKKKKKEQVAQRSSCSLDIFIVLVELLVVEPELIHEVGGHLLDLVVGEGLEEVKRRLYRI